MATLFDYQFGDFEPKNSSPYDATCEVSTPNPVPYEMHERVTGIMSAIQDVMVNIQGEKSV